MHSSRWLTYLISTGLAGMLMAAKSRPANECNSGVSRPKGHPECLRPNNVAQSAATYLEARVVGTVKSIHCGMRSTNFQQFLASIDIEHTLHGTVPSPLHLSFTRFKASVAHKIPDMGVHFKQGERVELILTRNERSWAVEFPFHKRTLRDSFTKVPDCPEVKRTGHVMKLK